MPFRVCFVRGPLYFYRSDLSINRKLNEPIPKDARLYIVSDEETYRRIKG
jgi:hypothetical protein